MRPRQLTIGGTGFIAGDTPSVPTYADLPPAADNAGNLAWVQTTTGIAFVNRRISGWYRSNGVTWVAAEIATDEDTYIKTDPTGRTNALGTTVETALDQLDTAISGKAPLVHTHVHADITNIYEVIKLRMVDATSISSINIASCPSTIDGLSMSSGITVLLIGQSTASQNGIYVCNGVGAAMTRLSTFNSDATIRGSVVWAQNGNQAGRVYQNSNLSAITVGTTAITFQEENIATNGLFRAGRSIGITNSGVTPGTYNYGGNYTINFSVDQYGRMTAAYVYPISISYTQVYDFELGVMLYGGSGGLTRGKTVAIAENSGA